MICWLVLTLYVESYGYEKTTVLADSGNASALLVYDPDPFYDLDKQVCFAFGKHLQDAGWAVTIHTAKAASKKNDQSSKQYDLYVLCANTYNYFPDWAVTHFLNCLDISKTTPVVAFTIGAGSTALAKKRLDKRIRNKTKHLLASEEIWLFRPNAMNAESKEDNVQLGLDKVREVADRTIALINEKYVYQK